MRQFPRQILIARLRGVAYWVAVTMAIVGLLLEVIALRVSPSELRYSRLTASTAQTVRATWARGTFAVDVEAVARPPGGARPPNSKIEWIARHDIAMIEHPLLIMSGRIHRYRPSGYGIKVYVAPIDMGVIGLAAAWMLRKRRRKHGEGFEVLPNDDHVTGRSNK